MKAVAPDRSASTATRAETPRVPAIDRLRVSVLEWALDDPVPMAVGNLQARHALLVEVAAGGVWGLGEVWVNHPPWACRERLVLIRHGVVPRLAGLSALDPTATTSGLLGALLPGARQAGATGPVWHVLSGLDIALWDLVGKIEEVPVAQLLNPGRTPSGSIPVYASGIGPALVPELCHRALGQGVGAAKVRVGFGRDVDARTLRGVRAELGDELGLYADANRSWGFEDAVAMAGVLRDAGVGWIEEPLSHDSPRQVARWVEQTGMSVALGENLYGDGPVAGYLEPDPCIALVQPDPAKTGGLSAVRSVVERAAAAGVVVAPHSYSGAVATAAAVQAAAAFETVTTLEMDIWSNPLRTDLVDRDWAVREGRVEVPTAPGLGVALREDWERYCVHVEEFVVGRAS